MDILVFKFLSNLKEPKMLELTLKQLPDQGLGEVKKVRYYILFHQQFHHLLDLGFGHIFVTAAPCSH